MLARTMPTRGQALLSFRVELTADDFYALLKNARRQSNVARRLVAAEDSHATGAYLVSGYETDGLALRALAIAHAPKAVSAIDKALKAAKKKD